MAILGLNVRAFLNRTLSLTNRHLLQAQMMLFKQWAFALKMLILYNIHE
jgi:hypothetical protein